MIPFRFYMTSLYKKYKLMSKVYDLFFDEYLKNSDFLINFSKNLFIYF